MQTAVFFLWRECPSEILMDSHCLMEFGLFLSCTCYFYLSTGSECFSTSHVCVFLCVSPVTQCLTFWSSNQGSVSATYITDKATFPHNAHIFSIIHTPTFVSAFPCFLSLSLSLSLPLSPSLRSSSTCPPIIFSSFR